MNTLSDRNLVSVSRVSAARDIVRIVIAAVVAGTGFAVLMALAVLSLTVIAPPVQASGAPALTSSASADMARATENQSEASTGSAFIGEAAAARPLTTSVPAVRNEEAPAGSLPSLPKLAASALVLALLVGVAVLIVRARSRQ